MICSTSSRMLAGLTGGFQAFVGKLAGVAGSLALILTLTAEPEPFTPIGPAVVEDVAVLVTQFLLRRRGRQIARERRS